MADQVQIRRNATANFGTFAAAQGELIMDTTKKILYVGDGSSQPGVQVGGSIYGSKGSFLQMNTLEGSIESMTSGSTFTAALAAPPSALVVGAGFYIETVLSGPTAYEFGISTSLGCFGTGLTSLYAGYSYSSPCTPFSTYGSSVHLVLTETAGSAFSASGTIRFAVQYLLIGAPNS